MIQRIQTVLLAVAMVCQSLLFATALAIFTGYSNTYNLSIFGFYKISINRQEQLLNFYPLLIINILIIILTLYIIFSYKNRRKQILLTGFNMLLISAFVVLIFYDFENARNVINEGNLERGSQLSVTYGIGMVLPLISIIMNFFAIRNIRKDEKLVKSADRIR